MKSLLLIGLVGLGSAMVACAPADVAGEYTVSLTNQENGCNISNWAVGQTTTNVGFNVTQSGANASGTLTGVTALAFDLAYGGHIFNGTVAGNHVSLRLDGNRAASSGGCAYTAVANVEGDLNNDTLSGRVIYTYSTNNHADCGSRTTCQSIQAFNGVRPPR